MKRMYESAPVLYQLSEFIVDDNREYNKETIHQAVRVIADTIGTAYSGIKSEAFQRAILSKNELFGEGDFRIIGTDFKTSMGGAVFYNTLAISSTDFDEGHRKAVGHPASMIVPLALILGEHLKVAKIDLLKSVIIGYEIATRFSNARIKKKITTYSSGRWGAIGAAATASYLLGLTIEQTMQALSNAAILSPVMLGGSTDVSTGSMSKEGAAWAAQTGLQSTLLSKEKFVGPYLFVDDHDDYDKGILIEQLGESWLINSNYFKPYACCRWLHSSIVSVKEIKNKHNILFEDISGIEVSIFGRAIDLIGSQYPQNPIQAQFHLPYCIAIGILFDEVTPDKFCDSNIRSSDVKSLVDIVIIKMDNEYNKLFPAKLPSKVTIRTLSGKMFSKEVISAPWDADKPPSDNSLYTKLVNQTGDEGVRLWNELIKWETRLV